MEVLQEQPYSSKAPWVNQPQDTQQVYNIAIGRLSIKESILRCLVDSTIHFFNNWGQQVCTKPNSKVYFKVIEKL